MFDGHVLESHVVDPIAAGQHQVPQVGAVQRDRQREAGDVGSAQAEVLEPGQPAQARQLAGVDLVPSLLQLLHHFLPFGQQNLVDLLPDKRERLYFILEESQV